MDVAAPLVSRWSASPDCSALLAPAIPCISSAKPRLGQSDAANSALCGVCCEAPSQAVSLKMLLFLSPSLLPLLLPLLLVCCS